MRLISENLIKLLNNFDDGLYYVNAERKIEFFNEVAEKITGFNFDEIKEHKYSETLFKPIDELGNELCLEYCPIIKSIDEKKPIERSIYFHHKKGHKVSLKVKIVPIFSKAGKALGAIKILKKNF